jgi:hypothetical protein
MNFLLLIFKLLFLGTAVPLTGIKRLKPQSDVAMVVLANTVKEGDLSLGSS